MGILVWVLIGTIAGWMVSMSLRFAHESTLRKDSLTALLGGLSGTIIFQLFSNSGSVNIPANIIAAFIGAVVALYVGYIAKKKSAPYLNQLDYF